MLPRSSGTFSPNPSTGIQTGFAHSTQGSLNASAGASPSTSSPTGNYGLSKIAVAQVSVLLSTLKTKKDDPVEYDNKVDRLKKVCGCHWQISPSNQGQSKYEECRLDSSRCCYCPPSFYLAQDFISPSLQPILRFSSDHFRPMLPLCSNITDPQLFICSSSMTTAWRSSPSSSPSWCIPAPHRSSQASTDLSAVLEMQATTPSSKMRCARSPTKSSRHQGSPSP